MEEALLNAIRAAPDDPSPKLRYADWLYERADPPAGVIRAREDYRTHPGDHRAVERFLEAVTDFIASRKPGAPKAGGVATL